MHKVITVDGPAGSGKGTVTKLVAKKLNYSAMDTGTIYRSIALYCRRNKISENDLEGSQESSVFIKKGGRYLINDTKKILLISQSQKKYDSKNDK